MPPDPKPSPPRLSPTVTATLSRLGTSFLLGGFVGVLFWQIGALDALGIGDYPSTIARMAAVGLVAGLVRPGLRALLAIAGVLFSAYLIIVFSQPLANALARWVRADALPVQPVDAVVVLSGSIHKDSSIGSVAVDRLLTALELVKAGAARRVITTRTTTKVFNQAITSDFAQHRLVSLAGLDSVWTVAADTVRSTRDEAVAVARILPPAAAHAIAVVTSPIHTRRACQAFEAVGFQVYCVPAREHEYNTRRPTSPADHLATFRDYMYERIAMVKYRWKGWLPARSAVTP